MKKCKQCGNSFSQFKSTQIVCSVKCAVKLQKDATKQKKAQIKEMKLNLITTSSLRNVLQVEINSIIRTIDYGSNCISCGKPPLKVNAGHFYSVGSHPSIRFHLFNNWVQCEHCNTYLSGNLHNYRSALTNLGIIDFISDLPTMYQELKLSRIELLDYIGKVRSIKKELKPQVRTIQERIELRKQINNQLDIYIH